MEMKATEILASYKNASSKTKQIGILAELNACTRDDIIEILEQMGESVPKRKYNRKKENSQELTEGAENTEKAAGAKKEWEEPKLESKPNIIPEFISNVLLEKMEDIDQKLMNLERQKKEYESQYYEIAAYLGIRTGT